MNWWAIDQHVASTLDAVGAWPTTRTPAWDELPDNDIRKILIRHGHTITETSQHTPPRGEHLGTINHWGLDVYENSPQEWIDTLYAEEKP